MNAVFLLRSNRKITWALNNRSLISDTHALVVYQLCACGGWPLVKHSVTHPSVTLDGCSQQIQHGDEGCGASSPPANGLSAQAEHSSPQPALSDHPNQIGESDIVPTAEDCRGNFPEVPHLG